jgi:hypothetical protein
MTRTEEIAKIANTSVDNGALIRNYIEEEDLLDWSECTQREFKSAVLEAAQALGIKNV